MSKTPLISLNDGTSWADAVPKLRTDELGASTTDWVQEGDTKAASLKVMANGTYAAASAGKYGYDYVTVSVKGGSATGIGPDGNEHTVTPDPETGKLVDEVIPSSIVVTTPPTVTTYQDGDTIDFTGIVVTAYTLDGEVWEDSSHPGGVIPISELEFPVTTAVFDPEATPYIEERASEFATVNGSNSRRTHGAGPYDYYRDESRYMGDGKATSYIKSSSANTEIVYDLIAITTNEAHNETVVYADYNINTGEYISGGTIVAQYGPMSKQYTYDGKSVYWAVGSTVFYSTNVIPPSFSPQIEKPEDESDAQLAKIAWTMFYGDIVGASGGVSIPVNWQRPGDGAVLEASFPINVTPAST